MKSYFALLAMTVCAAQASQTVNINAQSQTGTNVTLDAGTYKVSVIGTSQGGMYNGWDYATANFGTASATPAPNSWVDSFTITSGGVSNSYVAAGNPRSDNALDALATYKSSVLDVNGVAPATNSLNSAFFTLTSTQAVNFTAADYLFVDNWGGTSLDISKVCASNATPEPSTFGLMGLALAGTMAAFRRKIRG